MSYSPRQLIGWMYFLNRYHARRRAETLATQALATQGEGRKIKSAIDAALKDQ